MIDEAKTNLSVDTTNDSKESSEYAGTIEETREELARMYLLFLDKQKGGMIATGASLGVNLNPFQKEAIEYMTSDAMEEKEDIFSRIGEKIKKQFVEKFTGGTMIEYDRESLNKMRALIMANKDNQTKLQELMDQIASGIDPTVGTAAVVAVATSVSDNDASVEYTDKTERERVLTELDKVLEEDKKDSINYLWGGRKDPESGFDCSGLIYYTLDQAGLDISRDSRSMFKDFDAKKLELKEGTNEIKTDVSDIKEGDIIWRNSTNKNYRRNTGEIPRITKNNTVYRIHHVAFIKHIDKDSGIITIIEANSSKGVTESKINITEQLHETTHKSELYVAHIPYDELTKKTSATTTPIVA